MALPLGPAPFLVAHRAANHIPRLHRAEALGIPLVEADVRLFHGRLEVRHLKTVGPLPILWDRWELANPFAPRLLLSELLGAVAPSTGLMLDLKGWDRRLPGRVLAALRTQSPGLPLAVCSRSWALLEPFRARPGTRLVHSVGNARQLRALRRRVGARRLDAVSIHERLLDRETANELSRLADVVMTWPVTTMRQARRLLGWGVTGLITDVPEALVDLVSAPGDAAA